VSPGPSKIPFAVVVSAHGFGHAARASALVDALLAARPTLHPHILSTVPRWFFADSLSGPFTMHRLRTDVGLVQRTPLEEDLQATVRKLDALLGSRFGAVDRIARRLAATGCRLVISDIAPLGLAAARRAGVPSVLLENFTWDWIYRRLTAPDPALVGHADALAEHFAAADLHIQTEPVCRPRSGAVTVPPVARAAKEPPGAIRRRLGIAPDEPMVLLTMGGIGWGYRSLGALVNFPKATFVVPGGGPSASRDGRLVVLPFRSEHHHPDLVRAADVVVGKLGYSTVAETWRSGSAMAYITRPRFPESAVLEAFVRRTMSCAEISEPAFNDGSWLEAVDRLLEAPRRRRRRTNGAAQAAAAILDRFGHLLE
jgi:hypothetical protein